MRGLVGVGVVVLGLVVVLGGVGWVMVRGEPGWYRVEGDAERVNAGANRFEDELVELRNWAAGVGAAETRELRASVRGSGAGASGGGGGGGGPKGEYELVISGEELTAFVRRWATINGVNEEIAKRVEEPVVTVEEGLVVVGGRAKGVAGLSGAVVAGHFGVELTEKGELWVRLEKVTVGRLRVPVGLVSGVLERGAGAVEGEVKRWRADARVDERGRSNTAMTLASGGRVVVGMLRGEAVEGAGFLPMDERRGLGVRVVGVKVGGGEVRVVLRVLPVEERKGLGERVRGGK